MAVIPMADAVAGNVASAAEYNKIIDNVESIDARTTVLESSVSPTLAGRVVTTAGAIHTGIAATEVNVTKLAITGVPTVNNVFYTLNVNLMWNFATVVAGDSYLVRVRSASLGGTVLAKWQLRPVDASAFDESKTFALPWKATSTNASTNFYVSIQRVAGSGNISLYGDSVTSFWIDIKQAAGTAWQAVA